MAERDSQGIGQTSIVSPVKLVASLWVVIEVVVVLKAMVEVEISNI